MRPTLFVLVGIVLGGCSSSTEEGGPDGGRGLVGSGGGALRGACEWRDETFLDDSTESDETWLVRAPGRAGVRVLGMGGLVGRRYWSAPPTTTMTRIDDASLDLRSLAWTGEHYLGLAGGRYVTLDERLLNPQPLPGAGANLRTPCEGGAGVVEMEGRALLWQLHPVRGRSCAETTVRFQMLDAKGAALGPMRALSQSRVLWRGDDLGDDGIVTPRPPVVQARWDFGRVVVESTAGSRDDNAPTTWVLDPSGEELARYPFQNVACPRTGCVRLVMGGTHGLSYDTNGSWGKLLVTALPSGQEHDLQTEVRSIGTLAVSGDRVLVLHRQREGNEACRALVLDTRVDPPDPDRLDRNTDPDTGLSCAAAHVRPTLRGFVVSGVRVPPGASVNQPGVETPRARAYTRALSCPD